MGKSICFTIDVEPDFGGLLAKDEYDGIRNLTGLRDIVDRFDLRLTAFVTGRTLEENTDVIGVLRSMNAEIEQHSYCHQVGHQSKIRDIEKGIETHKKILRTPPVGYRSPMGIITKEEILFLEKMGVMFDASIFPTFFPGRFNRIKFPVGPFKINGSSIIEIPFGVVPHIRIPISFSYIQLLGLDTFKYFFRFFGLHQLVVCGFHTHDLGKIASYNKLPKLSKLGYYRAQRMCDDPMRVFERFVKHILSQGYESKYMVQVYNEIQSDIPTLDWQGD